MGIFVDDVYTFKKRTDQNSTLTVVSPNTILKKLFFVKSKSVSVNRNYIFKNDYNSNSILVVFMPYHTWKSLISLNGIQIKKSIYDDI